LAVYTHLSDADLRGFLSAYDVGSLSSFSGIAQGVENTNYRVETSRGRYILTLYEKRVEEADLPFFLGLMQHLQAKGLACPTPLITKSGEMLSRVAGRPAAMVTFLEGHDLSHWDEAACADVGRALAQLHDAGTGFGIKRANALSLAGWKRLTEQTEADAESVSLGLRKLVADEFAFLEARWPRALPYGVIHADLFSDNVFFLKGRLSGLIDFYFACQDFYAYDLAICLNAWCFDADYRFVPEQGAALVNAYHAARPLTPDERSALPLLARGAALRFLLTRLYDWINTPADALVKRKDPLEYLARLRYFQTVEDSAGFGLS
jgi:homoserine kinase type II